MSKSNPFFSVIIPTRNRSTLLKRSINSVKEQIFQDWELIVVDDGSEDDTKEVVLGFKDPRIKYFYQVHQERSTARNRGIEEAQGRYVCFIDDDDCILETYLSDFYDFYKKHAFPALILRTGYLKEVDGNRTKTENYKKEKHKNPVYFTAYNMCGVWSLSIPRSFLEVNRFPTDFPHWQDTHLIIRLLMIYNWVQLENYNYVYLVHNDMGSKRAVRDYDPLERVELNIRAIRDLFTREKESIYNFVPKNTLNFLISEKYIQYYNNLLISRQVIKVELVRKSLSSGFFIKLWKSYTMSIILTCKIKLGFG